MWLACTACISSLPDFDAVGIIVGEGQAPVVIVPWDDLSPTKTPFSVPPAMILYVTPQASLSIVTVAVPLVTEAFPEYIHVNELPYAVY